MVGTFRWPPRYGDHHGPLPDRPACLTHGDLWAQNILATPDGQPALIDPAVS
ncbi:fructosamine kinase family protein [Micromonospora sp. NPDC005087]|uniref:fructosamine kinase family protein n=1 Tax=Micromonospora sp. NPDC005087 TaxID=3364225 RepID=UPI0036C2B2C7